MNVYAEQRCMICQRTNPEANRGAPPPDWGVTTDKDGEAYGVICPPCITGELFSLTTENSVAADAA